MVATLVTALASSTIIIPMFMANPKLEESDKVMGTAVVVIFWIILLVLNLIFG